MASTTQAGFSSTPQEVLSFAVEQGVDAFLPSVLAMTQREFSNARRIELTIEDDPEIPDDRHIVIEVDIPGLDPAGHAEAKLRWGRELFKLCPATLVCVFRCALRVGER